MLPESDPFSSFFRKTFEANYHPHTFQNEAAVDSLLPQAPPFSFYDRHVGTHLLLENVVYCPSLIPSLSKTCEQALQRFLKHGRKLPDQGYNFTLWSRRAFFNDAQSVNDRYYEFAGRVCPAYASKFEFHPELKNWKSVVEMIKGRGSREYQFMTESWLEVTDGLGDKAEVVAALREIDRNRIKRLRQMYPRLATWDMFAMTPTATNMFQSLTRNVPFQWETCKTLGWRMVCARIPPPDAGKGFDLAVTLKSWKSRRSGPAKQWHSTTKAKTITTPKLTSLKRRYRPNFRHYIQHAWATAVAYDSTYLILHCGRYERIGYRHRASQTLYLSGVIDTINIQNPSYRKLQIGLHIAIVQDALQREKLMDTQSKNGHKRSAEHLQDGGNQISKRQKIDSPSEVDIALVGPLVLSSCRRLTTAQLAKEIAKRNLLLVNLDYGAFCSPAPSSFLRVGPSCFPGQAVAVKTPRKTRYNIHDYVAITLKEPLGHGAVGVVHPAVVEITLDSGETIKHNMALKLAFTKEQQEKFENEYKMYGYLSGKGNVEGIVTVHGMFQDPESGAYGMLMDDAGQSLRRREIERGGDGWQISTTIEEREAFTNALKSLHRAGVRHHDIRADNLLLNSQNKAFIIDLDQADHKVDDERLEHELDCLKELLEGRYEDGSYYT